MDPRYRAIFKDELQKLDQSGTLSEPPILDELMHAFSLDHNEGILPTYGALILDYADHNDPIFAQVPASLPPPAIDVASARDDLLRELADGQSSFFRRHRGGSDLWVTDHGKHLDEADLARLTEDAVVVQLLASGTLRIIGPDIVAERRRNRWHSRPTSAHYCGIIADGEWTFPGSRDVLQAILDLCLHRLSPSHIGATIIWTENSPPDSYCVPLGTVQNSTLPGVSLVSRGNHGAVGHLLSQRDGATIVNSSGEVTQVSMRLFGGSDSEPTIEGSGSRHASAAAYSGIDPAAWIFVVSHDGPLTILHDNRIVADRSMILMWEEAFEVCPECEAIEGGFGCGVCGETGQVLTPNRLPVERPHSWTWI